MAITISNFNSQLLAYIGATTAITDIVVTRYYNSRLPQNSLYPALVFSIITNTDGAVTKDNLVNYDIVRVQFDAFSNTADDAVTLIDALRTKFTGFTDQDETVLFHETFFKGAQQLQQDFDTKTYWQTIDFDFHIK